MSRRATSPDGTKVERRKSHRFPVSVPIEVSWRGADGKAMKQEAIARQVNANGGMLEMTSYPEIGWRVTLNNFLSAETADARVLATPYSREGVAQGIVVELIAPSESFWGVDFQARKTAVELQKLEKALRSGGIDLRLLKEFREAVEYVHVICGAVQQLRERQLQGREDEELTSQLAAERLRRAANLCQEILADFDAGRTTRQTRGIPEFSRAVEEAASRFKGASRTGNDDPVLALRR